MTCSQGPRPGKSDGVHREGAAMKYAWIAKHTLRWPVCGQCRVLSVSASGYRQHLARKKKMILTRRHLSETALLVEISGVCLSGVQQLTTISPQRHARTKNSRQRRLVQVDLPLRAPQRGSGKSRPISEDEFAYRTASASGSGKKGFIRFTVSAACGADLACLCRASPQPSTPWPWYRQVAATPILPCPAIHDRRA